jgi:hypothetical protein
MVYVVVIGLFHILQQSKSSESKNKHKKRERDKENSLKCINKVGVILKYLNFKKR